MSRLSLRYGNIIQVFNCAFVATCLWFMVGAASAQEKLPLIVAFGDSLTAGYGLAPEQAFPVLLERKLKELGHPARIQNAGVSGDTTAGGKARLDWALAEKPQYVLLELGANDALRGLDPVQAEANLDAMLTVLKARGIKVLLVGMKAPPNFGKDYVTAFEGLYPRLAAKHKVPLFPFFLDGVAGNNLLNLADGIHPNPKGVAIIVDNIAPFVVNLLKNP